MNIKQLRYVVAIANSGTFREASEQLFVSQPSMSIAVKDLEQELGFQNFLSQKCLIRLSQLPVNTMIF